MARALTFTIVFESSAVNKDEGFGNAQYMKKLRRSDGVYAYISRPFLRHHLFNTLHRAYGWRVTGVSVNNEVVQFDISKESVVTSEELDFFGYMSTDSETATRKSPIGMTKAIALERWESDSAFYANHDMVRRAVSGGFSANPNPYSREEFYGYFKYSVSMDLERIGRDEIRIPAKGAKGGMIFGVEIKKEDGEITLDKGKISWKKEGKFYHIVAEVNEDERIRRIEQFIEVLLSGFELHSSGESYSTSPVFVAAAALKAPLNALDPFITLKLGTVDSDILKRAFENPLVERGWVLPLKLKLSDPLETDEVKILESTKKLLEEVMWEVKK